MSDTVRRIITAITVCLLLPAAAVSGAAEVRDPAEWPFDARSPWNYPIGSDAVYEQITMPRWAARKGGYANIEWYSIPTYVAASSDPLRAIYDRRGGRGAPGTPAGVLRVPELARAAQGSDGHLNIIDDEHEWVHEFYHAERLPSGDLRSSGYVKNDLTGLGAGFAAWHGTVASGTSSLGGMIRKGELVAGTGGLGTGIRHALQGVVLTNSLNRNAPGGSPCPGPGCRPFVWPASSADSPAFKGAGYDVTGNVYMGSLLAIPRGVDISRLGIDDPQALEVARAMQDYGVYIIDQGNIGGRLVVRIDPQAAGEIKRRDAFIAGLGIAVDALMVVTNSHANGRAPATPGGGGSRRRPLAPPFR